MTQREPPRSFVPMIMKTLLVYPEFPDIY